jgi:hypothetical protein
MLKITAKQQRQLAEFLQLALRSVMNEERLRYNAMHDPIRGKDRGKPTPAYRHWQKKREEIEALLRELGCS